MLKIAKGMGRKARNAKLRDRQAGFTLVEMLVVITIIGTLIALLLPAIQAAREATRRTQCANNVRQIGISIHNFESGRRRFPAGYEATMPYVDGASDTSPGWGWGAAVLPLLEESSVFKRINFSLPIDDSARKSVKLLWKSTLKVIPGAPHAMAITLAEQINNELLAFVRD